MRPTLPFLLFVALALPLAAAQEEDGCAEASPCPLEVTVEGGGFSEDASWTVTHGDWYQITVLNLDDVDHTVTLEAPEVSVDVPAVEERSSAPFAFETAGEVRLTDDPSGDSLAITVTASDAVAVEEGGLDEGSGVGDGADGSGATGSAPRDDSTNTSALALAAATVVLAGLAMWHRRP